VKFKFLNDQQAGTRAALASIIDVRLTVTILASTLQRQSLPMPKSARKKKEKVADFTVCYFDAMPNI
jgi:hypothetical protein